MTPSEPLRRPTSLAEMNERDKSFDSEEGRQAWRTFQPQASDVIISPHHKSGTTWLQQMVHGLRTRGDMDFDDISRVVPWIETAHDLGLDLNAPQRGRPRAFKSHLDGHEIPKGARYLVAIRDPKDVLVSAYRFMEGWWFESGSIDITTWAQDSFLKHEENQGYWAHLRSWWERRHEEQVLLLAYEEMKVDLPGTIRTVANFIGVELDAELLEIVSKQSSLEFMLAHKDKFDDRMMRERSEKTMKLPTGSDSAKVRKGEVGSHRYELPAEISAAMDAIWRTEIEATLGFPDYDSLRQALRQLQIERG
jgi:hypothetical protein